MVARNSSFVLVRWRRSRISSAASVELGEFWDTIKDAGGGAFTNTLLKGDVSGDERRRDPPQGSRRGDADRDEGHEKEECVETVPSLFGWALARALRVKHASVSASRPAQGQRLLVPNNLPPVYLLLMPR